jgi:hypothetical protein
MKIMKIKITLAILKIIDNLKNKETIVEKYNSDFSLGKGPIGFGSIKIGMTKESIDALKLSDGVFLDSPMIIYKELNDRSKAGVENFTGSVITPLSEKFIKTIFAFEENKLIAFTFNFDKSNSFIDKINSQISEKYGPGETNDQRKDEQCIYKNGANFKINTGIISTNWSEKISITEVIETSTTTMTIESCPNSLSDRKSGVRKIEVMSIRKSSKEKQKNLF